MPDYNGAIDLAHLATPARNPDAGRQMLYPKSDGRWYTKGSNAEEWPVEGYTHHAKRYCNTGQSIQTGNTGNVVLWNAADALDGITYNAATGEFTVPHKGRYLIAGSVTWAANATGIRSLRAYINGASERINNHATISGQAVSSDVATFPIRLAAGDKVSYVAIQNSGAALALNSTTVANWCAISWLGPSA